MKDKENLTHSEILVALSDCFRQLIQTDIAHRNMPNIINRGKAAAQLVTAMHREQLMELKRRQAETVVLDTQEKEKKKLKAK